MIKVIGVGFPRTGTLSLKKALEELGFGPCYHMTELLRRPKDANRWLRAAESDADWDEPLAGYRASVDWPGAAFWRELTDAYPDAKVILTVRESDKWFASMQHLLEGGRSMSVIRTRPVQLLVPPLRPVLRLIELMVERDYGVDRSEMYDGTPLDRDVAIAAFERHNAKVQEEIDEGRLLVFRVSDGWEPLCEFLGCPVPDVPFPHANERSQFHRNTWRQLAPTYGKAALGVTVGVGAAIAGVAMYRRGKHRRSRRTG